MTQSVGEPAQSEAVEPFTTKTGQGSHFFGVAGDTECNVILCNGIDTGTVFCNEYAATNTYVFTLYDANNNPLSTLMYVDPNGRLAVGADLVVGVVPPGGTAPNSISFNSTGGFQITQGVAGNPPLLATTSGAAAGEFLNIYCNGAHYKIALLLP